MRIGLFARKLGMTRILTDQGDHIPVTLLMVDNCEITAVKTISRDRYSAIQIGIGHQKSLRTSNQLRGHFKKANVEPKQKVGEFRADGTSNWPKQASVTNFTQGQYVDVTGIALGKGFSGPMKRHGFKGLPASHGVSVSHRSLGSSGSNQDPGRVLKGKKMAGHMGANRVTVQNLYVILVDPLESLLAVIGGVPGPKRGYVRIYDSIKKVYRKKDLLGADKR